LADLEELLGIVEEEPPKVQEMIPANGVENVNPNLEEIRIVFDRPMNTEAGYSIVGGGSQFPKMNGQPNWEDERTFVFPVKLKAGWEYQLSVNSATHKNFVSQTGETVVPYFVSFSTSPPTVAKTVPAHEEKEVDPKTRTILVTFNQEMNVEGGWSIVGGGEHCPELDGRPKWIDEYTMEIPLKELKSDRQYHLSLNSVSFKNFRTKEGIPLSLISARILLTLRNTSCVRLV